MPPEQYSQEQRPPTDHTKNAARSKTNQNLYDVIKRRYGLNLDIPKEGEEESPLWARAIREGFQDAGIRREIFGNNRINLSGRDLEIRQSRATRQQQTKQLFENPNYWDRFLRSPDASQEAPPAVQEINLSNNLGLKELPIELFKKDALIRELNISDTSINFLQDFKDLGKDLPNKSSERKQRVGFFSKLKVLNSSNTPISKFRFQKGALAKWGSEFLGRTPYAPPVELVDLNLSNCKDLRDISGLKDTPRLEKLGLANCRQIKKLSEHLLYVQSLQELDLSGNKREKIPQGVFSLKQLKKLSFGKNCLKELPEQLQELNHLEQIDLSHNRIRRLSPVIKNLTSLEKLDISGNYIQQLPDELNQLDRLKTLDVRGTFLRKLPEWIDIQF
ncbi:MAG: hypothetical protein C5B47_00005, partial [Verrucomicrobia bacterium]